MKKDIRNKYLEIGALHNSENPNTPIDEDKVKLPDDEKIELIEEKIRDILDILGLDLKDESIKGTPYRVAKMWVKELFYGIREENKPKISTFKNGYRYKEMITAKNIELYSTCEHHLLPIVGIVHIAYYSSKDVVGLSKINRIVDYYAKRPQVQERLTTQIANEIKNSLGTQDVACLIDAKHLCVNSRGVKDTGCSTVTSTYLGRFQQPEIKREFIRHISIDSDIK